MNQSGVNQIAAIVILCVCAIGGGWGIYYTSQKIDDQPEFSSIQTHPSAKTASVTGESTKVVVGTGYGVRATAPSGWTVKESTSQSNSANYTAIFENDADTTAITLSSWDPAMRGSLLESVGGEEVAITVADRTATKVIGTNSKDGSASTLVLVPGDDRLFSIVSSAADVVLETFLAELQVLANNE